MAAAMNGTGGGRDQLADALRPAGGLGGRATPNRAILTRKGWLSLMLSVVGVSGFLGLLLTAHDEPDLARPLRIAALVWFFAAGFMKVFIIGPTRGR